MVTNGCEKQHNAFEFVIRSVTKRLLKALNYSPSHSVFFFVFVKNWVNHLNRGDAQWKH
jgi:hypothetical protein